MVTTLRKNKHIRQQQVADAAQKLIIKCGSEHLTVRKIAMEIGVTEGAVYRYFASKKEILTFLLDNIENSLISNIKDSDCPGQDSLSRLKNILDALFLEIRQKKGMSFQIIAEIISLGDKKLNQRAYLVVVNFNERIKEILKSGVISGQIRQDINVDGATLLLFGLVQGLTSLWTLNRHNIDMEKDYQIQWNLFRAAVLNNSSTKRNLNRPRLTLSKLHHQNHSGVSSFSVNRKKVL